MNGNMGPSEGEMTAMLVLAGVGVVSLIGGGIWLLVEIVQRW